MTDNTNMKKFKSADMHFSDHAVKMLLPLSKIDEERRTVSGFATLDNEDTSADIVTADASAEAFSKFRGNIREMHQPIAAGRLVDFATKSYFDPDTNEEYTGVYVTAYVSKGAQATWEKVLDGTLSGFSIHGGIEEAHTDISKATGEQVRIITKYSLDELSLVDNPANQFANVFSIEKSKDGSKATGISTGVTVENIFFCDTDNVAKCSQESTEVCEMCNNTMENIAWLESSEDRKEKIAKAISEHKNGGETVANNETEKKEEAVSTATQDNSGVGQADVKATEEAATVDEGSEVGANEQAVDNDESAEAGDLEKVLSELRTTLSEVADNTKSQIEGIEKKITEVQEGFTTKFTELTEKHEALTKKLESVGEDLGKVTEKVASVEKGTAVKKSAELDTDDELEKSKKSEDDLWKGAFLNV